MISFVIPAHNEEALLGATLSSIKASAGVLEEDFEVLVVDDASEDRTGQIAESFGARVVSVACRRISAARNAGAKQARGDVLIFVDADTILPEATLRAALHALEQGAVGGGALVAFAAPVACWARLVIWGWNCISRTMHWAAGCFVFVRRDAFQSVGGFDERYYIGEEIFLSKALKHQGRFVIVAEKVVTSGRKTQMHGPWVLFCLFIRLVVGGPRAWRRRDRLDMWYNRSDADHS